MDLESTVKRMDLAGNVNLSVSRDAWPEATNQS